MAPIVLLHTRAIARGRIVEAQQQMEHSLPAEAHHGRVVADHVRDDIRKVRNENVAVRCRALVGAIACTRDDARRLGPRTGVRVAVQNLPVPLHLRLAHGARPRVELIKHVRTRVGNKGADAAVHESGAEEHHLVDDARVCAEVATLALEHDEQAVIAGTHAVDGGGEADVRIRPSHVRLDCPAPARCYLTLAQSQRRAQLLQHTGRGGVGRELEAVQQRLTIPLLLEGGRLVGVWGGGHHDRRGHKVELPLERLPVLARPHRGREWNRSRLLGLVPLRLLLGLVPLQLLLDLVLACVRGGEALPCRRRLCCRRCNRRQQQQRRRCAAHHAAAGQLLDEGRVQLPELRAGAGEEVHLHDDAALAPNCVRLHHDAAAVAPAVPAARHLRHVLLGVGGDLEQAHAEVAAAIAIALEHAVLGVEGEGEPTNLAKRIAHLRRGVIRVALEVAIRRDKLKRGVRQSARPCGGHALLCGVGVLLVVRRAKSIAGGADRATRRGPRALCDRDGPGDLDVLHTHGVLLAVGQGGDVQLRQLLTLGGLLVAGQGGGVPGLHCRRVRS